MQAKVLDAEIELGNSPVITGLSYDLEKLLISFDPGITGIAPVEIIFRNPRGFRCLDEGGMFDLWNSRLFVENWLFEITEGGWLDLESQREGFLSKHLGYREFLICGVDDCVSVISNNPPEFQLQKTLTDNG